jgi:hypothetical protein
VHKLVSFCSADDQGAREVARALVEQGQLDLASFPTWDDILKEISRQRPPFLTIFVEETLRILTSPDALDQKIEPYRETIYTWLDHILTSKAWTTVRRQYLSPGLIVAVCRDTPGYWTNRLLSVLENLPNYPDRGAEGNNSSTAITNVIGKGEAWQLGDDLEKDDDDLAVLRKYGWDIDGNWKSKPIGIV